MSLLRQLELPAAHALDHVEAEPEPAELRLARRLEREKYAAEEWLHQRSPQADATASAVVRTPGGLVRLYLAAQGRTIKSALFAGDYNEVPAPLARLEAALRWSRLEDAELRRVVVRGDAHDQLRRPGGGRDLLQLK